ncbi:MULTISPECIES: hypothetical protein [unclassified Halomonas]|uniref:hypothetical protein n=1 Tax=unclassified Halomonas TaxID=2609666 RepID=UPI001EF4B440|nr:MULTISPECIES: hypothetical protein [unclassified Halomonas]MCG7576189.1 hypothetical protein [Halomonas sp. MMH1-48]MCG7603031.1 hypothetical protein [Halomonas sp. MM17-34]MCG7612281.1 hypothetical protein [Halomonas sp. MM17-29]MCG7619162.1 hypothetical protein [Halomonas sp. DSH1-27]
MSGDGIELNITGDLSRELTGEGASGDENWPPKRPDAVWFMYCACQELERHAHEVVDQTFRHLNILDHKGRTEYLAQLEKSIVDIRLKDRQLYQSVEFEQYKFEGDNFKKHCADQAIRYAVAALEEFNKNMRTSLVYPDEFFLEQSGKSFALMINWIVEARRHLAALEILKNVSKKMYTKRAVKGGHSRSRSASEKNQRKLLEVMITGLMYADPEARIRAERNTQAVVDEWAGEIYELNKKNPIFSWCGGLNRFRGEVLDVLVEKLKKGESISDRHMRSRLRFRGFSNKDSKSSSDASSCEDAELIRERGQREGVQFSLIYLLEQRFGELPNEGLERVKSISDIDDFQTCLDRLPEASSWQTVLQVPGDDK